MKKKLFLIFFLQLFTLLTFPTQASALFSKSIITKVGTPTGPEPVISSDKGNEAIVAAAAKIAARLKQGGKGMNGPWYSYDPSEPNIFYWCDYIVIDSWAAAGVDIKRPATNVGLGYRGWLDLLSTSGFHYLQGKPPVSDIQPGDMVLMTDSTGYHVAIVGAIKVVNGNGEIQTYDSNSWDVTDSIDVVNGFPVSHTHNIGGSDISGFGVPPQ